MAPVHQLQHMAYKCNLPFSNIEVQPFRILHVMHVFYRQPDVSAVQRIHYQLCFKIKYPIYQGPRILLADSSLLHIS
jgi:hypothetical protein